TDRPCALRTPTTTRRTPRAIRPRARRPRTAPRCRARSRPRTRPAARGSAARPRAQRDGRSRRSAAPRRSRARPPPRAGPREREVEALAYRMRHTGADHVVDGLGRLEHLPHRLDVLDRITPVALGGQIAHAQLVLETQLDARDRLGDLARDEFAPSARRLVVE